MAQEKFDIDQVQVQMAMVMKMNQLKRETLPALTYQTLERYVSSQLWQKHLPRNLNTAVDDIMKITAENIVNYLSDEMIHPKDAVRLDDFADLIGG